MSSSVRWAGDVASSLHSVSANYRILEDGRGWHLHLTYAAGWPKNIEDNPFGLYLYVKDVDAMAAAVRDSIIEEGAPYAKPWGTYEFAVSDLSGLLVRFGRLMELRRLQIFSETNSQRDGRGFPIGIEFRERWPPSRNSFVTKL